MYPKESLNKKINIKHLESLNKNTQRNQNHETKINKKKLTQKEKKKKNTEGSQTEASPEASPTAEDEASLIGQRMKHH